MTCGAEVSGVDHLSADSFEVGQDEQGAQQAGRAGGIGAELGGMVKAPL